MGYAAIHQMTGERQSLALVPFEERRDGRPEDEAQQADADGEGTGGRHVRIGPARPDMLQSEIKDALERRVEAERLEAGV
jgi:hypothetical protein